MGRAWGAVPSEVPLASGSPRTPVGPTLTRTSGIPYRLLHEAPTLEQGLRPLEIRALFFAVYREVVGVPELRVDVPAESTVEDLVRLLKSRGAPFDVLPSEPAVAVNRSYARIGSILSAGDEVAFIPPVAGG